MSDFSPLLFNLVIFFLSRNGTWSDTEVGQEEKKQPAQHKEMFKEGGFNEKNSAENGASVLIDYDLFKSLTNTSEEMGQFKVKPLPQSLLENHKVPPESPPTTETVVMLPNSSENVIQPLAVTPKIKTKHLF